MVFELTLKLADEILQALDNQEQTFLVDAKNARLVPVISKDVSPDDDSFYALPEWTSSQGFKLREDFVSALHSPIAKDELQRILHSGRGVFRSFKNTLKKYPEVEKLWHQFKNRMMLSYINDWYNQLREIWGLEKLDQEPEDNEDLLNNDFQFFEYSSDFFEELIHHFNCAANGEFDSGLPQEIQEAVFELWLKAFKNQEKSHTGIICHSLSGEFAGCITSSPVSDRTDKIVCLTSYYVQERFRGLGIGAELLSRHLNVLKDQKKEWILLTSIIPDSMEPLLINCGFQRTGSCFSAKIQD